MSKLNENNKYEGITYTYIFIDYSKRGIFILSDFDYTLIGNGPYLIKIDELSVTERNRFCQESPNKTLCK